MKRSLRSFAVSVLLAVLVLLVGAGAAWSADPIHIALSAPLTGNFAEYGQLFQKPSISASSGSTRQVASRGAPS